MNEVGWTISKYVAWRRQSVAPPNHHPVGACTAPTKLPFCWNADVYRTWSLHEVVRGGSFFFTKGFHSNKRRQSLGHKWSWWIRVMHSISRSCHRRFFATFHVLKSLEALESIGMADLPKMLGNDTRWRRSWRTDNALSLKPANHMKWHPAS